MTVQGALLPGTDTRKLAGRLADMVGGLPVPAAAALGQIVVPASVMTEARQLGERQGMLADAAADFVMFLGRMWYLPDARYRPQDWTEVAVDLRTRWESLYGVHSGLVDVTVFPVGLFIDTDQWLAMAHTCGWWALTSDAPDGLIPGR